MQCKLVLCNTNWYSVVQTGILQYKLVFCITNWYSVVQTGTLQYKPVLCSTRWHSLARRYGRLGSLPGTEPRFRHLKVINRTRLGLSIDLVDRNWKIPRRQGNQTTSFLYKMVLCSTNWYSVVQAATLQYKLVLCSTHWYSVVQTGTLQ